MNYKKIKKNENIYIDYSAWLVYLTKKIPRLRVFSKTEVTMLVGFVSRQNKGTPYGQEQKPEAVAGS